MSQRFRKPEPEHKEPVHPIWRGIGCLLIIIVPIVAFAASTMLVQQGIPQQYIPMSRDLATQINVPLFGFLPLYYVLIITGVISILGFVVITVIYSFVFRVGGSSRYGPLDADPKQFKRKTKKSR
jgi:hypothetical protein